MVPGFYAPQLTGQTPRKVKITANSILSRALQYLCSLAIFAISVAIGLSFVEEARALFDHGKTTQARLISKNISTETYHRRSETHWNLNYQYTVGKAVYSGSRSVSQQEYQAAKIGSHHLVTYLPERPQDHYMDIVTKASVLATVIVTIIFSTFFAALFLGFIAYKEIVVRNQIRLLRDGVAGQAIVASKKPSKSAQGGYVTCNFYTGQQPTSKEFSVPQALYNGVDMGSTLTVLYLPNDPQFSQLYQAISDVVLR